ncbi:MAG TPA: Asp-tRNA(Asn)/Glu-tRNA(Gln) amidotransferase subunit GatA [Candidatus Acidoferrales bacterium]|jgi:aspartyl-tRNA(Asn)/glutamyl-tRNA(Gln) amidotransferase subunit A|nr:Asp-tRNA(Asn)/Glu-tRNA(Gln) amidotransferase subunit GatA [Candidatus Acidoferrales bacterium]
MSASTNWTVAGIREALTSKKVSARELAREFYGRIEKRNAELNVYLTLSSERAFAQADKVDAAVARGEELPALAGVPIAVKDAISTKGVRTTCGSKILENYIPPYDATAVERLENAGAMVLGKTNCDEFAMGSSNENSAYGPVRNPVAPDRVPGGSSGGSGAAVAAGLAVAALGTDTGGSIRQPASYCGVAGLMPTYGRVSRYGLVAFASSLDKIGPFTTNVADAAAVLAVMAGHDPRDSTSANVPVDDYSKSIEKPIERMRIGVPQDYFGAGLDPEVKEKVEAAIGKLEEMGCQRIPLQMPHTDYAIAAYYIIATAEASSNLARYDGVRYGLRVPGSTLIEMYRKTRENGFGAEVKRRIMLGTYALSAGYYDAYYLRAQRVRALIARDFSDAFQKVDAIVTPTAPTPAFRLGEKVSDPLEMYLADIYTVTGSLAGVPGISTPCGSTKAGLPVGMQIFGPHFKETNVLQIARAFEKASPAA